MLARLASIPRRAPLAFSVAYGGAKTIAADVLVQKYLEGREKIDQTRSLVFLGFGCFQVGFVQYMVYSKLFPFIFKGAGTFSQQTLSQMARDKQGLRNVLKQVALDMLVYHPCCYFPVFYTCQEVLSGNVSDPTKTITDAVNKYIPNAVDDWVGLWKIFVPVSLFQNSFCPVYLRVPCVATAGFFYCIVLSMTRGDEVHENSGAAETAEKMVGMSDEEFAHLISVIRSRYSNQTDGIGQDEFSAIMRDLGLSEASSALFEALDNDEGLYPRGSGVVDAMRLVDGLNVLAGRYPPDQRAKFIAEHPEFLPQEVPSRLRNMSTEEFHKCIESIRSREWSSKEGVNFEEFSTIMETLGLCQVSRRLFDALDNAAGRYPPQSGRIDLERFIEGLELLADRCTPEERIKFIAENPQFLPQEIPARLVVLRSLSRL